VLADFTKHHSRSCLRRRVAAGPLLALEQSPFLNLPSDERINQMTLLPSLARSVALGPGPSGEPRCCGLPAKDSSQLPVLHDDYLRTSSACRPPAREEHPVRRRRNRGRTDWCEPRLSSVRRAQGIRPHPRRGEVMKLPAESKVRHVGDVVDVEAGLEPVDSPSACHR